MLVLILFMMRHHMALNPYRYFLECKNKQENLVENQRAVVPLFDSYIRYILNASQRSELMLRHHWMQVGAHATIHVSR